MTLVHTLSIFLSLRILSELSCIYFLPERERVDSYFICNYVTLLIHFSDINNNVVARQRCVRHLPRELETFHVTE